MEDSVVLSRKSSNSRIAPFILRDSSNQCGGGEVVVDEMLSFFMNTSTVSKGGTMECVVGVGVGKLAHRSQRKQHVGKNGKVLLIQTSNL